MTAAAGEAGRVAVPTPPGEACLDPHVALPRPDCERWVWAPPGGERVRVVAWTCPCRAVFYELCQVGGSAFVRRTVQRDGAWEVRETARVTCAAGHRMWQALLSGEAR
ncbi:hypothetical protein [Bailinhaonella thermotolerans]|uniref:Uncharacterized protein n=1 Tax=Bailinhaonella thermotolerans TaxID=1070861 RepID=A0A3A4AMG2_9ACTN|nr:hypothetical protein [Bailinhaonella thermotolerans]RJL30856.1 hypothetical protein D5H75_21360 [Bailinhaonella thermotolerans]